jgi:hypothetical protein
MVWSHQDILMAKYNELQTERAEITAEYERARLNEDGEGLGLALDRYAQNDSAMRTLNDAAVQMQRAQQNPQIDASFAGTSLKRNEIEIARKAGLSAQQMEAAMSMTADPSWNPEDKARAYLDGLRRVRDWRAAGNTDEVDRAGKR